MDTGRLPKKNDKIQISLIKKRILKTFIVGKYAFFFKKFKNKLNFQVELNLQKRYIKFLSLLKTIPRKRHITCYLVQLASYDQYSNFIERGNHFKKLVKNYVKKLN